MAVPVPDVIDLAAFTGRDQATYSTFVDSALEQAALLFTIATGRADMPTDADQAKLALFAILEMADRIYLEQPYAATVASPFQSETIGSYSYSKGNLFRAAKDGVKLGLVWWDLALDELRLAGSSIVGFGGISVFERELFALDDEGSYTVVSPGELAGLEPRVGFYNANNYRQP